MSIEVGEFAPDFTLPCVTHQGRVSLSDYRGRQPVLLAILRGLYCPFCRQHLARLAATADRLSAAGIATLGIVATPATRARLYCRLHYRRFPLAADPGLTTHRAFGLPWTAMTPEICRTANDAALAYARAHRIPAKVDSAYADLNTADGYRPTKKDAEDAERHQAQLIGQFLVDRDGVVNWVNVERAPGELPSEADPATISRCCVSRPA